MDTDSENKKFAIKDQVTNTFSQIVFDENKRRSLDISREVFNSAYLTECDRRILYRARGEQALKHSEFSIIDGRDSTKNKWSTFFSKSLKINLLEKDLLVADCNYNITGIIDSVIKIGNAVFVVMIKDLSSKEFSRVEKRAFRKDIVETMINMWLSEIQNGILLYENRDTGVFSAYHIIPYVQIIEACKNKCLKMVGLKIKGGLPEKPYKNNEEKECQMCEFQTKCWEIK